MRFGNGEKHYMNNHKSTIHRILIPSLIYTLLAFAATYPAILTLSTRYIGGPFDTPVAIWNLWWIHESILHLKNPYFTQLQFYPAGTTLAYHTLDLTLGLLTLPLIFLPLAAQYNLLILFNIAASCLTAHILARRLIKNNETAAYFMGISYGLSTYAMTAIYNGHLNLLTTFMLPLALLLLLEIIEAKKSAATRTTSTVVALAVILTLQAYTCIQTFIYTLIACGYVLAVQYRKSDLAPKSKLPWKPLITAAAITAALMLPLILITLTAIINTPTQMVSRNPLYYGVDLMTFILPTPHNYLIRNIYLNPLSPNPAFSPIGYVTLTLALATLLFGTESTKLRAEIKHLTHQATMRLKKRDPIIIFPLLLLAIAAYASSPYKTPIGYIGDATIFLTILLLIHLHQTRTLPIWHGLFIWSALISMGMIISINSTPVAPGPYLFVYAIPPMMFLGTPYRFLLLTTISATVLASQTVAAISRKRPQLTCLIVVLLLIELFPAPTATTDASIPAYYAELAKDPEGAILEIPLSPIHLVKNKTIFQNAYAKYPYYQTLHHHPIVGGYISREPQEAIIYLEKTEPYKYLTDPESAPTSYSISPSTLWRDKIKYVIIHKDMINNSDLPGQTLLPGFFRDYPAVYEDEETAVYRVY
ncbi:Uncharacterised protein [uncultured archaeon]|nr:Uncharacterised protein [uncultured archaeon]